MIKKGLIKLLDAIGYEIHPKKQQNHSLEEITGFKPNNNLSFLVQGKLYLVSLKQKGALFSESGEDFYVRIQGLQFRVNSWEELFILNEVFVEEAYHLDFPSRFALIDIGMNVGITSLYFANHPRCEKIFAYEPFEETTRLAEVNFSMNPQSSKIHITQAALGFPERTVHVKYSSSLKGSVGIFEKEYVAGSADASMREMEIKDVFEQLNKQLDGYAGEFIAKIDCEGAEYEIIQRLNEQQVLGKIAVHMIEWHAKGPDALIKIFIDNNFSILHRPSETGDRGMIYAFRK